MSPSVEPFNEAKYKALMDGLEINEIQINDLERTARIDAEFYKKENLAISAMLKKKAFHTVTDFFSISDGNHMSISEEFQTEGVPYYRGQDIYNTFIEEAPAVCIDYETYMNPHMVRSHLIPGDVLMSIVGAIVGNTALVSSDKPATCSCKLSIIRSNNTGVLPEFLLSFIRTKYGQNQIQKFKRGAAQTGFLLEDFDQILLPVLGLRLQNEIKKAIDMAHSAVVCAANKYHQAELILLSAIKYSTSEKKAVISSVKTLKKSFVLTGRLDAEYYQPKYENIAEGLNTSETVLSLCNIYDDTFIPIADTEYRYIELANVGHYGDVSGVERVAGKDLPSRARRKVATGEVIISSVEGSLQSCALIDDEFDGTLCSTGFYILDSDEINSETLLVLFKSEPIQALMKQRCSGTILTAIGKDELLSMPFPKIDSDVQKAVAEKVQESFALRRKSNELLEYAKQAVEMAIEQGEDVALEWLKEKVGACE